MKLRRPTSRWALWLFAAAFLLKAAMPMLATASAQVQGKALVEVCTVYGMSMVSVDGDRAEAASAGGRDAPRPVDDDAAAHLDHQCTLTALALLATPSGAEPIVEAAGSRSAEAPPGSPASHAGRDAAAAWVAGRKHGPPRLA